MSWFAQFYYELEGKGGGGDKSTQFEPAFVTWTRHDFTAHTDSLRLSPFYLNEKSCWTLNSTRLTHADYHRDNGVFCCLGGTDKLYFHATVHRNTVLFK